MLNSNLVLHAGVLEVRKPSRITLTTTTRMQYEPNPNPSSGFVSGAVRTLTYSPPRARANVKL